MKTLKEIIEKRKAKAQFEKEAVIKAEFAVVERDGFLWLTHDNIAFMKIASLANAGDVAKSLNQARETAIEFERL